jgi:cell wall-associated NlpC family hydrolase
MRRHNIKQGVKMKRAFIAVLFAALLIAPAVSLAGNSYTVKKGDNLYRIAKKFKTSVENIKELNGLSSNALKTGQSLIVKKEKPVEETADNDISAIKATYDRSKNPVIASARLQEVRELAVSEDISNMSIRERLTLFAKKMLHLPYNFGGSGAFGIDCSAYVQKVYGLAGINLPRSAREQFHIGEKVDKKELSLGDLVFFKTYASFPSHVGIYLGNNLFIHASTTSKKITIDNLDAPYYVRRFIGAKRLVPEENPLSEEIQIQAKDN